MSDPIEIPKNPPSNPKEKKGLSSEAWVAIITAVIGLVGTIITLIITDTYPRILDMRLTQTAEARQTLAAGQITPTQTNEPAVGPTWTATGEPSSTPTPTATAFITNTPTITAPPPGLQFCVNVFEATSVWVRGGPDTTYQAVGTLLNGACLFFDAADPSGMWLRISPNQFSYPHLSGAWVRRDLLGLFSPANLPEVTLTPPPTGTPEPSPTPTPQG
ncbi:MAG: hypothetical protein ABIJ39_02610 [Chloroflexota bacterium]